MDHVLRACKLGISKGFFDALFLYMRRSAKDPKDSLKTAVKVKGSTQVGTDAPDPDLMWMSVYAGDSLGDDGASLPSKVICVVFLSLPMQIMSQHSSPEYFVH